MKINYADYLDRVLGGWIGKSMGGAVGARFEGNKGWIEIEPAVMFPDKMPPNDDLDLQVLWLKVLEEKGPELTSDDLAKAWMEGCWYPFNEYGIFRRNWGLGIHPPYSGKFTNQFWETGMGCPIRAEVWGYVFPGAPDLAAKFAEMDGRLDHTEQSVGAEKMFAAMSSMAFFVPDVRRLAAMFIHYLPVGTPIERLTRLAFECYDKGVSLRDARDRIMLVGGNQEACDAMMNVPFTFLGLLYGKNDLEKTMLAALKCGYDTDCTLATSAALLGQIIGAKNIPEYLKKPVGDELVMGIEYRRQEMTISALARDTARVGVLMARHYQMLEIDHAPEMESFPASAAPVPVKLQVDYEGLPAAAPGDSVVVYISAEGKVAQNSEVTISAQNPGWKVVPDRLKISSVQDKLKVTLIAPSLDSIHSWPMKNLFDVALLSGGKNVSDYTFGVAGSGIYQFLGAYYDARPSKDQPKGDFRAFEHHFVGLDRPYLPEEALNLPELGKKMSDALGQSPILYSHEHEIDVTRLTGLRGSFCAYVSREVCSPNDREVFLVVGNTDSFRLYLNGEKIAEEEEIVDWTPFNNVYPVKLRKGKNLIVIKMLRRGDSMKFTLGIRGKTEGSWSNGNNSNWCVDLSDGIPTI